MTRIEHAKLDARRAVEHLRACVASCEHALSDVDFGGVPPDAGQDTGRIAAAAGARVYAAFSTLAALMRGPE